MATSAPKHESLLTLEDVRAKRRDIVLAEKELVRLSAKLETDRKEFQQMLVFVPAALRDRILSDDAEPDMFVPPERPKPAIKAKPIKPKRAVVADGPRSEGYKFSAFITDLVSKSRTGISHSELKAAVQGSDYASRLEDQAKAYHRAVSKLVARKEIVRHGGRFYARPVYQVLKKNGDLPPIVEGVALRENGAAKITLEVLQGHPDGLTGPDLKVLVGADPAAPKSVAEHGQYIYNVLATLIGSGRVVKNGNLYQALEKVRPRGNGASDTHASDLAR